MRSPLPFPCVPDRPYKILLAQVGGDPVLLPPLVWCVRFIYLWDFPIPTLVFAFSFFLGTGLARTG